MSYTYTLTMRDLLLTSYQIKSTLYWKGKWHQPFTSLCCKSEIMHYQNVSLKITNTENLNDIYTLNHEKYQTTNVFIDTSKKVTMLNKVTGVSLARIHILQKNKESICIQKVWNFGKSVLASVYPDPINVDSDSILVCFS